MGMTLTAPLRPPGADRSFTLPVHPLDAWFLWAEAPTPGQPEMGVVAPPAASPDGTGPAPEQALAPLPPPDDTPPPDLSPRPDATSHPVPPPREPDAMATLDMLWATQPPMDATPRESMQASVPSVWHM